MAQFGESVLEERRGILKRKHKDGDQKAQQLALNKGAKRSVKNVSAEDPH